MKEPPPPIQSSDHGEEEYTQDTMAQYSLEAKYDEDHAFVSGLHAIVRGMLDQSRRDADDRHGFVSGYQGSPLGTLDIELSRQRRRLLDARIRFQPGLNEELALTSVWGSQMVSVQTDRRVDGVWGAWYGKAPGLDRSLDALRHANLSGCSSTSGAVAIVGDDPAAKSSTVPSASEAVFASASVPVIAPRTIAETPAAFGHAIALSRHSGLWAGLKIVTALADSTGTVDFDPFIDPQLISVNHQPSGHLLAAASLTLEQSMYDLRLPAAIDYIQASGLNRVIGADDPRLTIVAGGVHATHLMSALASCGLDERWLANHGIRLVSLAWLWPLSVEWLQSVCGGLVWVVDDKRSIVRDQVAAAGITVIDDVMPLGGEADPDRIVLGLHTTLTHIDAVDEQVAHRAQVIEQGRSVRGVTDVIRTPSFCSGCPHNTTLKAADGTLVGAGIGCHTMVLLHPQHHGDVIGLTQMGGEGAQWIGMEGYLDREHLVQNLGDGTYHHSGSLAIRSAVAAKSNITYRIMFNSAVAMTGGQDIPGGMSLQAMCEELLAEDVKRIIVLTDNPGNYDGGFEQRLDYWNPTDQSRALSTLADIHGVTVLIYDGDCAAERRRGRKRGTVPQAEKRIWINERVCEGCGDCGDVSSCISVEPVDTVFGRKTRIHQASCNADYTCTQGNCPSFLEIAAGTVVPPPPPVLPELPEPVVTDTGRVRIVGIGGTGIVTVSQILGVAAQYDGKTMHGLDQTGLSQKGGPVVSDVIVGHPTSRIGVGEADCLIVADLLTAMNHLNTVHSHTAIIANSTVAPTAEQTSDVTTPHTDVDSLIEQLGDRALVEPVGFVSEQLFHDNLPINMMMLGMASQSGALPVSAKSIIAAIGLNGVAIDANTTAFNVGRTMIVQDDFVTNIEYPPFENLPISKALGKKLTKFADEELRALLERNAGELMASRNEAYADEYLDRVLMVDRCEDSIHSLRPLTTTVAESLYHVMAWKDEYEIARLHLDPREIAKREQLFGKDARVTVLLKPPLFERLGYHKKIRLRRSASMVFRLILMFTFLRGTRFDPFWSADRRLERDLAVTYKSDLDRMTNMLTEETIEALTAIAAMPLDIRGYESLKRERTAQYYTRRGRAWERLDNGIGTPLPPQVSLPVLQS